MADASGASGLSALSIEEQASDPSALTGHWKLFPKSDGIYAISPSGTVVGPFATVGGTGAAPADAKYIVQTADSDLSAEQALGALGTGLLKNTTTTGVLSIADATDLPAHASRHQSGGTDAVKLDDLAAPDDNTDLNATTSAHGLLPKLSNVATEYLDGTGAFSVPAGGGGAGTVDIEDEGAAEGAADTIDFVGAGVSVTFAGSKATVDIPGGSGGGDWVPLTNCSGVVGSGGAASVTLPSTGSLPTGYRAFKLVLSVKSEVNAVSDTLLLQPNGDTTAGNFFGQRTVSQNTTAVSAQNAGATASLAVAFVTGSGASVPAGSFGTVELMITGALHASKMTSCTGTFHIMQDDASGNMISGFIGGTWNATTVVTTLVLKLAGGDLAEHTEYALYGLT